MLQGRVHSQNGLKVWTHHPLDSIDLSELHQRLKVWLPLALSVGPEGFNGDIDPDFIPVFKAVDDSFFGRVDPHRHLVYSDNVNARAERWLGIPEDSQGDAVYFRDLSVAGQRDVDRMRNLRGQVMVSKR